jgi:hypothetical protein
MVVRVATALLAVLLLASAQAKGPDESTLGISNPAGPVPVVWFMHIDAGRDSPISPVAVPEEVHINQQWGAITTTVACLPSTPGQSLTDNVYHMWYGFSTNGEIQYHEDGLHADLTRDMSADLELVGNWTFHWYLAVQPSVQAFGLGENAPLAVPRVVVQADLRASNQISVANEAMDAAPLVASGRTAAADLSPVMPAHPDVEHMMVDGRHVYHFTVPLQLMNGSIAQEDGFNVRVVVYHEVPGCDADAPMMSNVVSLHSSHGNRPRLEGMVARDVALTQLAGALVEDVVLWRLEMRAPFGYRGEAPMLRVSGPDEWEMAPVWRDGPGMVAGTHCHCYDVPDAFIYAWPLDARPSGLYHVQVSMAKGEHTMQATAAFDTQGRFWNATEEGVQGPDDERKDTPGIGVVAVLLGVACGAVSRATRGALAPQVK